MCHYQKGMKNEIAFVFSCPGFAEKLAGTPAAGLTGDNLAKLFTILSAEKEIKISWNRKDITITNAWSKVEYKRHTRRTEAKLGEVLSSDNLSRLEQEIKGINNLIICCGDRAAVAVDELASQKKLSSFVKVIKIKHLGYQSLNQIKLNINKTPIFSVNTEKKMGNTKTRKQIGSDNTNKRLQVIASEIIHFLN